MRTAILRNICLLMAMFFVIVPAEAAKRVALVIGINSYPNLPAERQLKKAVNDARSIRDTLKADLGFDVLYEENADWGRMNGLIKQAEARLDAGDVVFIYFSGHGVSIGAENYLLPSDIPRPAQGEEARLIGNSFGAEALAQRLKKRGARAVFSVLDACRDNPFVDEKGKAVGGAGGLTIIDRAQGVFTLFAAGLGQVALDRTAEDDPNPNSVFTRSLIPLLKTSGLTQVDLAKKVQQEVVDTAAAIGHDQMPVYNDGLLGFVTLKESGGSGDAPAAPQAKVVSIEPSADELIRQCDLLTAHYNDPDRPAEIAAVPFESIVSDEAVRTCEKAIGKRPDLRRIVYQTGRAYDHAENYETANSYYKRAADMGSKAAMAMLSDNYSRGVGIEKNLRESVEWGKKALRSPNSWRNRGEVSYTIGYNYNEGAANLPRNPKLARAWYAAALDEGYQFGARNIAAMINNGTGGPVRTDIAALMLLTGYCRDDEEARAVLLKEGLSEWKEGVGAAVQETLKQKGFYFGDIDGVIGEGTRKALERANTTMCPEIEAKLKAEGGVFASLHEQGVVGEDPRKELQ